ncbi:hypothetical protein D3C76_1672190 [compost metagenome]
MAVAVIHLADQQDVLALRFRAGQAVPDFLWACRVTRRFQGQADVYVGAGCLRGRFRQQFDWHVGAPQRFSKWVLR